jgi:hypothetical protein
MMFKTNAPVSLRAWGAVIELPAGSRVDVINGFDPHRGDSFIAADVEQLIGLTGNNHDPKYRYLAVPASVVVGETPEEKAAVNRIRTIEAFAGDARGDRSHSK